MTKITTPIATPKRTAKPTNGKPKKPHKDWPLFLHATGQWCKKVGGRPIYFGTDADAAMEKWLAEKDEWLAGRNPRLHPQISSASLTVATACNVFLTAKANRREAGELAPRTFERLHKTCEFLVESFGKTRRVDDLRPTDFAALRAIMAKRWGPVALANEIGIVRSVFGYIYKAELLDHPVRFGPEFIKPSAKTMRLSRAARGSRLLSAEEIQAALKVATVYARAMLLLGINAALGNTDLALMPLSAVDLKGRWLDYPRSKTAVPRRIPLWKETVSALQAVIEQRREPNNAEHAGLVFVGQRGESYIGNHRGYRVYQELARVFAAAKIDGRTPYDLRHTFLTIAEGARDLPAAQSLMGHAPPQSDMAARYREGVDDDRLRAVTDHVHRWLFRKSTTAAANSPRKPR